MPSTLDRRGIPAPGHFANAISDVPDLKFLRWDFPRQGCHIAFHKNFGRFLTACHWKSPSKQHLPEKRVIKRTSTTYLLFISQHTRGVKQRKNTKASLHSRDNCCTSRSRDCNKLHKANYRRGVSRVFSLNYNTYTAFLLAFVTQLFAFSEKWMARGWLGAKKRGCGRNKMLLEWWVAIVGEGGVANSIRSCKGNVDNTRSYFNLIIQHQAIICVLYRFSLTCSFVLNAPWVVGAGGGANIRSCKDNVDHTRSYFNI